jgi:adenylate kinase family enzyme
MTDIIFIGGAQGTGKTTNSIALRKKLNNPPMIELDWLRDAYLKKDWSDSNIREEQMSYENAVFMIKNYIKYGFRNIIVNGLKNNQYDEIKKIFAKCDFKIIYLVVNDDDELKKRVLNEKRDSGFRDYETALEWNKNIMKRKLSKNEFLVDNTNLKPEQTLEEILKIVNQ